MTRVLIREKSIRDEDMMPEAEVRVMWGHKARNVGGLSQVEKARKQILPQSLQRESSPADVLILNLLTSRTITNLYYFKPRCV